MNPKERWILGGLLLGYLFVIMAGIAVGYHYG